MCFWLQQLGWFYLLTFCYVCKYQQLKVIMIFFISLSFTSWGECGLISFEIFRFFFHLWVCCHWRLPCCTKKKNIRCQVTWNIVNSCFALHIPLAVENVRYLCKFLPSMCVCVWSWLHKFIIVVAFKGEILTCYINMQNAFHNIRNMEILFSNEIRKNFA